MPHHKSAIKRVKTNLKRQEYNKHYKAMMKNAIKKVLSIQDKELGLLELKNIYSLLDRIAKKNIIHKNKAANQKSRLAKYVASL